jgi:hypothetical protein
VSARASLRQQVTALTTRVDELEARQAALTEVLHVLGQGQPAEDDTPYRQAAAAQQEARQLDATRRATLVVVQ